MDTNEKATLTQFALIQIWIVDWTLMIDFRQIITDELQRQQKSAWWLGQETATPHLNTVYRYLRGEIDLTGDKLAKILDALQIEVKSCPKSRLKH